MKNIIIFIGQALVIYIDCPSIQTPTLKILKSYSTLSPQSYKAYRNR